MSEVEEIIQKIERQLIILKELNAEMDIADWNYEEGVIITGNEAIRIQEILTNHIKKHKK